MTMPTEVWAIWADNGGAYEPYVMMSVWTTREGAEAEIARLHADSQGCNNGFNDLFHLNQFQVDTSYDEGAEYEGGDMIDYPRQEGSAA